jgi:hypothetical protein
VIVAYHMCQDPRGLWYVAQEHEDGSLSVFCHQASEDEANTESNRMATRNGGRRFRQHPDDDVPYPHGGYHPDAVMPTELARGEVELPVDYEEALPARLQAVLPARAEQ